jgi:membrane-bound serine protease (ClpP class)
LIALSLLLFYLETTAPGIGYFGVAGTITLILGGIFIVGFFGSPGIPGDTPIVSRWLLGVVAVSMGAFVLWFASELRKSKRITKYQSPTVSGNLIGATGVVSTELSPSGEILVHGEYWTGEMESGAAEIIAAGTNVEVISVDGNHLKVKAVQTDSSLSDVTNND